MFSQKQSSDEETQAALLRQEYEATDFGRRYGWWLCLREKRVADLNYLCWDWNSQFWHAYRVFSFDPAFSEIGFDADRWCEPDVSLESRYVEGFRACGILMAPRANNIVVVRSVCVPENEFARIARHADESLNNQ